MFLIHARILTPIQKLIWKAALEMDAAFTGTISYPTPDKPKPWRVDATYYKRPERSKPLPGNINLSPAWFQQGHYVWFDSPFRVSVILMCRHTEYDIVTGNLTTVEGEAYQAMYQGLVGRDGGDFCTDGCASQYHSPGDVCSR